MLNGKPAEKHHNHRLPQEIRELEEDKKKDHASLANSLTRLPPRIPSEAHQNNNLHMTFRTHTRLEPLLLSPKFGGCPKLGVPFLGVPILRIIVFWGLYWGPPILGNYHLATEYLRARTTPHSSSGTVQPPQQLIEWAHSTKRESPIWV